MGKSRGQGVLGYGTLVALVLGGCTLGLVLGGLGLQGYFAAAAEKVKTVGQGHRLVDSLEGALVLWSFGILAFLVAFIAFVVLLKGLSDNVSSARRGPVTGDGGAPPT